MLKVEVIADNTGKWVGNSLRFDTLAQAEEHARDLASRWMLVRQWHVVDEETGEVVAGTVVLA